MNVETKLVKTIMIDLTEDEARDFVDLVRNQKFDGVWLLREIANALEATLLTAGAVRR
jgi:hypothetical protein